MNTFIELDINSPRHHEQFEDFYNNVFAKSFPREEINDLADYLSILENSSPDTYQYHLFFTEKDNRFIACYILLEFPHLSSIIGEFSCVAPQFRGLGLSTKLMREAHSHIKYNWLFGEIESTNQKNLSIWSKFGFKLIPVHYQQLPLGNDRPIVDNLSLCVCPADPLESDIPTSLVKSVVWSYYRYSQACPIPENTDAFKSLAEQCDKAGLVFPLLPLPMTSEFHPMS